mmetsp:Transcript_8435/g.22529  ORF Transcript_8435/g.22529 Transcript_8435/m.22529 type:complete len:445 (-) Transcript_8435:1732-3066(-)
MIPARKEKRVETLAEKLDKTFIDAIDTAKEANNEKASSVWSVDEDNSDGVPIGKESDNQAGGLEGGRTLPPSLQKMKSLSDSLRASMDSYKPAGKKKGVVRGQRKVQARGEDVENVYVASAVGSFNAQDMPHSDLVALTESLCHRLDVAAGELDRLKNEGEKRQRSFMRREDYLKKEIDRLRGQLEESVRARTKSDDAGGGIGEMAELSRLRALHSGIQNSLGDLKDRASKLVEEHREDLVRHFRAKLSDLEGQLRAERAKAEEASTVGKGGVSHEFVEKAQKLGKELERYKEEAIRLDRSNDVLSREVEGLRTKCKSHEEDHEFLVRQMVALKRENSRLKSELERFSNPTSNEQTQSGSANSGRMFLSSQKMPSQGQEPGASSMQLLAQQQAHAAETARYKQVVSRLKRLLEMERSSLRNVRMAHLVSSTVVQEIVTHSDDPF